MDLPIKSFFFWRPACGLSDLIAASKYNENYYTAGSY